jgi:hypothetical protein
MQPRSCIATFSALRCCLPGIFLFLAWSVSAASLQTFAVVYGQLTNEIAIIESSFDNSSAQKQKLATLVRARGVILDPELRDEQALSALVQLLGSNSDYDATLDDSAANARAAVLSRYDATATRIADLPPSRKTNLAKNRFDDLASDANALANAQHAGGIAALLAPFGRRLESIAGLVAKAQTMPKPLVGANAVKAKVNGRRFSASGMGRPSSNRFDVSAPDPLYLEVSCRVVDGGQVITFTLPLVTEQVRYEVEQGFVSFTYTGDIFAEPPVTHTATSGTFFVQRDRNEVYGIFSAEGPGLNVQDGRFRIQLPRALRGS